MLATPLIYALGLISLASSLMYLSYVPTASDLTIILIEISLFVMGTFISWVAMCRSHWIVKYSPFSRIDVHVGLGAYMTVLAYLSVFVSLADATTTLGAIIAGVALILAASETFAAITFIRTGRLRTWITF